MSISISDQKFRLKRGCLGGHIEQVLDIVDLFVELEELYGGELEELVLNLSVGFEEREFDVDGELVGLFLLFGVGDCADLPVDVEERVFEGEAEAGLHANSDCKLHISATKSN